jgi:hypothetical protein
LLGLSQGETEYLLVLLDLGARHKGIFKFQNLKFQHFIVQFDLTEICETTQTYMKHVKARKWFVRVGSRDKSNMPDPGTDHTPSRIPTLERLRYKFKQDIDRATLSNIEVVDAVVEVPPATPPQRSSEGEQALPNLHTLVLARLQMKLFPLLFDIHEHKGKLSALLAVLFKMILD